MKHSSTRAVSAIAALTLVVGVTGAATSAAATKQNTFVLSGQVSGTLTLNSSLTCSADNIQKMPLEDTVRIYLTAHGISPASAQWFMLISAKRPGTAHYPAPYPDATSLGAQQGIKVLMEWGANAKGTVTLAPSLKSGSISLQMGPNPGQHGAKSAEKIVGRWSCP